MVGTHVILLCTKKGKSSDSVNGVVMNLVDVEMTSIRMMEV